MTNFEKNIFDIKNSSDFDNLCFEVFRFQAKNCEVYEEYLNLLDVNIKDVVSIEQIPFLPVQLFKSKEIITKGKIPQIIFSSSATTGMISSKHFVANIELYEKSFTESFKLFYGEPSDYAILSLLPSYLEREGSSLVYMAEKLMSISGNPYNGFYLYNYSELFEKLNFLNNSGTKTILLGVSFALLDFVKDYTLEFPKLTIIETGGMKGRGRELSREEIHSSLRKGFGVKNIHSEYGMAELLSQSYSYGEGIFKSPPWKRILIRNLQNPFSYEQNHEKGGINIIDLANLYSCSFIETEDMGIKETEDTFRILGRISNSELRGCNLLLG